MHVPGLYLARFYVPCIINQNNTRMKTQEKALFLSEKGLSQDEVNAIIMMDPTELHAIIAKHVKKNVDIKRIAFAQNKLYFKGLEKVKEIASEFIQSKRKQDYKGQWIFILLVGIVLVAVLTLALTKNIDSATTGNIISSVVGFSIGKFTEGTGK